MPRGVGYESLAALVDYLTKEEEDRQVPLSALADAARQGIGQGVVDPAVDFLGAGAAKIGQMARATPAGIGAMVSEDVPALLDMASPLMGSSTQRQAAGRQAGAAVRGGLSGLADLVAKEGPMEVATRGLRAAGEGINQQIDERGFAAFTGPEDLIPGSKILAALGMAVPAMRMGKGAAKAVKPRLPDFADEVAAAGGEIDESGVIRLFHRTTPEAAEEIRRTGQMTGKEDGVFFSTSPSNQAVGYGSEVVEVRIPLSDLELDDLFDTEAHLRLPLKRPGEMVQVEVAPEPPRRSLLARLAEGVEDPGALERGRLEGRVGDKYDANLDELQQIRDKLYGVDDPTSLPDFQELRRREAVLTNETDPLNDPRGRKAEVRNLDALDPVEKARLDRAVEQGWDIDAFHGTKGDIEAFDPGLLGETTGAPSARLGFFFAADPETAWNYSQMAQIRKARPDLIKNIEDKIPKLTEEVIAASEAMTAKKNAIKGDNWRATREKFKEDFWASDAGKNLRKKDKALQEYKKIIKDERYGKASLGQNIMPVKLRLKNPLEHNFEGKGYRDTSYRALLEQAKNKGHDGAIFRNTTDGGGMTDIYVVFEPAQIRSRYAAFDPKDTPKTGLRQNAKLANEALQVNRKQLEVLVKSKKAVEREYSDLWAVSDIFNKKAELALAEKKSPALREDMLELSNNIKALQDRMDLLEDEARKVTIGTGDITASFAPLVLPLGGGTAAAAYLANQEQE